MPRFVVERSFPEPLTREALDAVETRMAPCLAQYDVRWVRSFWSVDRKRMVCEYDARDAETVRQVQREARADFETVWAAELLEPAPGPHDQPR